jgi:hypothetical protein
MADERELESLRRENAELREQLAKASDEARRYRASANDLLDVIYPYKPLTQAETEEMFKPQPGKRSRTFSRSTIVNWRVGNRCRPTAITSQVRQPPEKSSAA